MVTTPEVLLVELMKLDPAEHPIVPQILDVVRNYPIQIQTALADSAKRSADPGFVDVGPVKALADQQAVELQNMLEAFTVVPTETELLHGHFAQVQRRLAGDPEPVVVKTEPFVIADTTAAGLDATPIENAQAAEDARFHFQVVERPVEEAHEPIIPAALNQGGATSSPNPTITVHGDNGDSGGANSESL